MPAMSLGTLNAYSEVPEAPETARSYYTLAQPENAVVKRHQTPTQHVMLSGLPVFCVASAL